MNLIYIGKNAIYFAIYADCKCDKESDTSCIGNKTTSICKQNPVCNLYYIVSELNDNLQSVYYESPLRYDNVGRFVNEVIKNRI